MTLVVLPLLTMVGVARRKEETSIVVAGEQTDIETSS